MSDERGESGMSSRTGGAESAPSGGAPAAPPVRRRSPTQLVGLVAGIAAFALLLLVDSPLQHFGGHGARPARAAAVVACMAIWWLTEALPIHWTACLPLVAFPLLRI